MATQSVYDILVKARERIAKKWARGTLERENGAVCAIGAIYNATFDQSALNLDTGEAVDQLRTTPCAQQMDEAINATLPARYYGGDSYAFENLVRLNDMGSKYSILKQFDQMIKYAEAKRNESR